MAVFVTQCLQDETDVLQSINGGYLENMSLRKVLGFNLKLSRDLNLITLFANLFNCPLCISY